MNLNEKINSNKIKHVLVENELKKLQTFELSLVGQSYFNNDGAQLYLIFQPIPKIVTTFSGLPDTISQWESKGLSNEKLCLLIQQVKVFLQTGMVHFWNKIKI